MEQGLYTGFLISIPSPPLRSLAPFPFPLTSGLYSFICLVIFLLVTLFVSRYSRYIGNLRAGAAKFDWSLPVELNWRGLPPARCSLCDGATVASSSPSSSTVAALSARKGIRGTEVATLATQPLGQRGKTSCRARIETTRRPTRNGGIAKYTLQRNRRGKESEMRKAGKRQAAGVKKGA